MIFAIDPSSTRCGYAVLRSADDLVDAGLVTPSNVAPLDRIMEMAGELVDIADEELHNRTAQDGLPVIVIEVPDGHVARRLRKYNPAGLSTYGMAVGAVFHAMCAVYGRGPVRGIGVNEWTGGVPKKRRAALIEARFPEYCCCNDPGLDVADAIGLAQWWFTRERAERMEREVAS